MARLTTLDLVTRAEHGAAMVIRDYTKAPNGDGVTPPLLGADGTPATLLIKGIDSATAKAFGYEARADQQNVEAAKTAAKDAGLAPAEKTAADTQAEYEQSITRMVAMTTGWSGIEGDHDLPDPFSAEQVHTLYVSNPQVLQDALLFHYRRADFFAHASPPSAPSVTITSA